MHPACRWRPASPRSWQLSPSQQPQRLHCCRTARKEGYVRGCVVKGGFIEYWLLIWCCAVRAVGMVLAAWGLAGVVGPTIYDVVKSTTGSLDATLEVFAGLFVIALIVSFLMKRSVTNAYRKIDKELKFA